MLSHSFLFSRDSLCARTKFPDCTALDLIMITSDSPGSRGKGIQHVNCDEGVLGVQEYVPHMPVLPSASLHEYDSEVSLEFLLRLDVPIVVSLQHLL